MVQVGVPLLISAVLLSLLTGCSGSTEKSQASTATAASVSSAFPSDVYPPPIPTNPGTVSVAAAACPNPAGLKNATLDAASALDVIDAVFASNDLDTEKAASDQAFWPLLETDNRTEAWTSDRIEVFPAVRSPYADLIAHTCSQETLELSWWVKLCPGPCANPTVAALESLTGNAYLINRNGRWLLWAEE